MKKRSILIILLTFALASATLTGQEYAVEKRIVLENSNGERFENCVFGIDSRASDGMDSEMGEFMLPGHPPSQLHALFRLPLDEGFSVLDLSYRDIRAIPDEDFFYREYLLDVMVNADTLFMSWSLPLDEGIDSAHIVDYFTGDIFSVDMSTTADTMVANEFLDKFLIKVWYNKNASDVDDFNISREGSCLYPNPAGSEITIKSKIGGYNYIIFSLLGEKIAEGKSNSETHLNIDILPGGIYIAKLCFSDGKTEILKFIKK